MIDNYLAVCISQESRNQQGIALHELFFAFDSADMRSVTAANTEAKRLQDRLEYRDVETQLAVYMPLDMLDLPVIAGEVEIAYRSHLRRVAPRRVQTGPSSSSLAYRKGKRIGDRAA